MSEALRRHVAAFNGRDLHALLDGFTDDAVWITGSSVVRGRDELTELFSSAMEQLLPTLTVENVIADGDQIAAQLTERLTHNGSEQIFAIAGFYRLDGDRIASAKVYREGSAELG
ncbi:nuclear transport factor 2 family protein [Amycolatopsis jejuensis]|uniref:nuclear transport factor 2 family protein n=1 Tax=Amycolatopsis jejuensis TaxID=330084 RepID=UPI00052560A2|nr:nuclear transport factor 2 family protein [Amycolatopsis jejuensis]